MSELRGERPRRVLIAHPGAELYGSDRVLLESVSALADRDWEVTLTVPTEGPMLPQAVRRRASATVQSTVVLRKSLVTPFGLIRLAVGAVTGLVSASRVLERLRPDVVYVSTVTVPLWIVAARLHRIPVIIHVHEAEHSAPRILRRALALPLRLSSAVVVNSRFSRDVLLADAPSLSDRTVVVYNGVAGPPEEAEAPRANLYSRIRLVYVGRLSPRKGVDVAVAAAAELARRGVPVSLRLVGAVFPGYEWYEEELRAKAEEARAAGADVVFSGFEDSPWAALAEADIALVPSRLDEPFGNTAVEAVLAARPAVVSRSGGLPEAVDGFTSSRLVSPDSVDSLVEAVLETRDSWSTRRIQAVADAELARERYSVEGYRARLADALESVPSEGAQSAPSPLTKAALS